MQYSLTKIVVHSTNILTWFYSSVEKKVHVIPTAYLGSRYIIIYVQAFLVIPTTYLFQGILDVQGSLCSNKKYNYTLL
jgi:hypothetical protein